jgi:hypothetical protein
VFVKLLSAILFTCASIALTVPSLADENQTVSATVTPLLISVLIDPTSVTYGTRAPNTTQHASNPTFVTVTNNGSVTERFNIKGAASTPSAWTLGATAGTNQYVHRFSTNGSTFTEMQTGDQSLMTGVGVSSNFQLFLQMDMPTTVTTGVVQQTLPVVVTALQQ